MLLAAVPIVPPPRQISMGPSLFARRLSDYGIAEIHQHAGAGLEFPLVWAAALAALADPDLREDVMGSPGAPFRDGVLFARWLLGCERASRVGRVPAVASRNAIAAPRLDTSGFSASAWTT